MSGGLNWDGQARDGAQPNRLVSPYDRPPVRSETEATKLPQDAAGRLPVVLAAWAGWVVIEDDGGADLIVYSGRAQANPTPAPTGTAVWIGDGHCAISYDAIAPTTPIRLVGCTGADAATLATAALAQAIAKLSSINSVNAPNGTQVLEVVTTNVANQPVQPPAGTVSTIVTFDKDNASDTAVSRSDTGNARVLIGPNAPLSSVTLYGTAPILIRGANGETTIFLFNTRT